MKVTEAFEGNYIDALCVTGTDATLTIESVASPNTEKSADGKPIDRPIVRFKETDKGLILNKLMPSLSAWHTATKWMTGQASK